MSTTPTIETELVADESKELLAVVQQNALPPAVAQSLQSSFAPLFASARSIMEKSKGIVVTDASQKLEIKLAGAYRSELKKTRVAADKLREELKRQSLRESAAVQGFFNILLHLTETEEKRLKEQEDFAEVQEAKRQEALKVQRTEALLAINADPTLYSLGQMSEETFQQLVEGVKPARAAAESRRLKEEADRIAREAADLAERERIRLENERLEREVKEKDRVLKIEREFAVAQRKKEQDEAFAKAEEIRKAAEVERLRLEAIAEDERKKAKLAADAAEIERKRIEAVLVEERRKANELAAALKKEADEKARKAKVEADKRAAALKEENDRIQAELQKERDAQAKRAADADAAERKARSAPDKDKLLTYANAIRALEVPTFSTDAARALGSVVVAQRDKFVTWIEEKAGGL